MREVLFRGKNEHGEWYYGFYTEGYYLDGTPVSWIEVVDREKKDTDSPTVIPETVGQFIGLTDKNGKRIWEGDIVRIVSTDYVGFDEIGRVEFKDGCFGVSYFPAWERKYSFGHWRFHRIGQVDKWQDMSASGEMKYTYEIIGNIHDNPELMEVSA